MTRDQMTRLAEAKANAGYAHDQLTVAFWVTDQAVSDRHRDLALEHVTLLVAALGYRLEPIENPKTAVGKLAERDWAAKVEDAMEVA